MTTKQRSADERLALNDPRSIEVLHQAISRSHEQGEDRFWTSFQRFVKRIESPIELLYAYALAAMLPEHYYGYGSGGATIMRFGEAQVAIPDSKYRVDFIVHELDMGWQPKREDMVKPRFRVAVELDGHDFHERTKEQAARDKAKDRFLQGRGFLVARFTGSEVWKDPFGCVDETFALLDSAGEKLADAKD